MRRPRVFVTLYSEDVYELTHLVSQQLIVRQGDAYMRDLLRRLELATMRMEA